MNDLKPAFHTIQGNVAGEQFIHIRVRFKSPTPDIFLKCGDKRQCADMRADIYDKRLVILAAQIMKKPDQGQLVMAKFHHAVCS